MKVVDMRTIVLKIKGSTSCVPYHTAWRVVGHSQQSGLDLGLGKLGSCPGPPHMTCHLLCFGIQ